jgi:casein kinase II subunit alpha
LTFIAFADSCLFVNSDKYKPGETYSVKVGSKHFKAPELLTGYSKYDEKVDIWSAGCIFAGLLFGDEPFFSGDTEEDELASLSSVLGSDVILKWADDMELELTVSLRKAIGRRAPIPLSEFITDKYIKYATNDAVDLLSKILVVDPRVRLSAAECLSHSYFCES